MCLLALGWNAHPRYRLVFAGNRDEFHARPAATADWWTDKPDVFGGRDLEAGGTWLGLRRDGRFAVVTNFREPDRRPAGMRSRGELATRFLAGSMASSAYLDDLKVAVPPCDIFDQLHKQVDRNRESEDISRVMLQVG